MITQLKKKIDANFYFSNILVPVIVLVCYSGSFAYFSSRFLLKGVSYFFASSLAIYGLFLLVAVALIFLVMLKIRTGGKLAFKPSLEKINREDFLLLLLPLTPVVQYVLHNQDLLSVVDSVYVLIFFLFFSSFYIFAIPAVLSSVISTRTLMVLGLAFVFTITSMASISDYFAWFEMGSLTIQVTVFGFVFVISWFLYKSNQRRVLYSFIVVNFIASGVAPLLSQDARVDYSPVPREENVLLSIVAERMPAMTPNIYLLIYDSYVPNETMLAYGIDNGAQESYLSQQGFELYPHTYSINASSVETMSRVLNASTEYYGDLRRAVSGDGITHTILKEAGYKTYGLFSSDYMFLGYGESYDYSSPERSIPPYIQLLKAILIGEFRFNIETIGFNKVPRAEFLDTKQSIFADRPRNQFFVYMHTDLPSHSQNSGACLFNEVDLFEERLRRANLEMKQDINLIIENDPGAIVIVAGDHGPYLTKNCHVTTGVYDISEISRLDIQDRYGTFLAIRWPTDDFVLYDDITVLQDLFPAVFAYLYEDTSILKSKIEPIIVIPNEVSGASVNGGVIIGGMDDGESLYLSDE
ncbi:MAG TPA: hypothetical protein VFQ23_08045 [Anaerolineales bacterium]|nr:hypothetical protein [Anaerolineales bacterium]